LSFGRSLTRRASFTIPSPRGHALSKAGLARAPVKGNTGLSQVYSMQRSAAYSRPFIDGPPWPTVFGAGAESQRVIVLFGGQSGGRSAGSIEKTGRGEARGLMQVGCPATGGGRVSYGVKIHCGSTRSRTSEGGPTRYLHDIPTSVLPGHLDWLMLASLTNARFFLKAGRSAGQVGTEFPPFSERRSEDVPRVTADINPQAVGSDEGAPVTQKHRALPLDHVEKNRQGMEAAVSKLVCETSAHQVGHGGHSSNHWSRRQPGWGCEVQRADSFAAHVGFVSATSAAGRLRGPIGLYKISRLGARPQKTVKDSYCKSGRPNYQMDLCIFRQGLQTVMQPWRVRPVLDVLGARIFREGRRPDGVRVFSSIFVPENLQRFVLVERLAANHCLGTEGRFTYSTPPGANGPAVMVVMDMTPIATCARSAQSAQRNLGKEARVGRAHQRRRMAGGSAKTATAMPPKRKIAPARKGGPEDAVGGVAQMRGWLCCCHQQLNPGNREKGALGPDCPGAGMTRGGQS